MAGPSAPPTARCRPTSSTRWQSPKRAPQSSRPESSRSRLVGSLGRGPQVQASALVQSPFVPQRPPLVKGVVVEPLPNGVYRVELENGAKVLAHVADRAGTHFTRLLAGDKVGVELATSDRSRGRIREIWR